MDWENELVNGIYDKKMGLMNGLDEMTGGWMNV